MNNKTHPSDSQNEFYSKLKRDKPIDDEKHWNDLLDRAYTIRQFELDLYWKRAAYFWAFNGATLAAYFIANNNTYGFNRSDKFILICIGLIFSWSWYLVNRGSTYWTTNWERIIDTLEEKTGSKLYKFNLQIDNEPFEDFATYYPFSVSRVNIVVSLFVSLLWMLLMGSSLLNYIKKFIKLIELHAGTNIDLSEFIDWKIIISFVITLGIFSWLNTLISSPGGGTYSFFERTISYAGDIKDKPE